MQVADMIKMLETATAQLKKMDPTLPVAGHISSPYKGYCGDMEDPIKELTCEDQEGEVVVYLRY